MNYVDIIARQTEMQDLGMLMQKESQELQDEKIEFAHSHTSLDATHRLTELQIDLALNYDKRDHAILTLTKDSVTMDITIDEFNGIGQFLQKHNDCIFSYMSEITKTEDEADEEK